MERKHSLFLLFLSLVICFCNQSSKDKTNDTVAYYDNYKFTLSDSVINIGIQPLYLPASLFTELITRDKILEQQLDSLDLKINFYKFLNGKDIGKFISEKKLNIGIGGDLPALIAIADNDFYVPLCVQNGNVSYISSKPIMMQDIVNKKIGVPNSSIAHYGIVQLLKVQNSYENNKIIFSGLDELATKLKNGDIDIIGAWEPYASNLLKQNKNYFVVSQVSSTGFLYTENQIVKKHPKAIKYIIASFLRAWNYLKSERKLLLQVCQWNLKDIKTLMKDSLLLGPQEISEIANQDLLQNSSFPNISSEDLIVGRRLQQEYIFLNEEKLILSNKKWDEIVKHFDTYSIQEVLHNEQEYKLSVFSYR